MAWSDLLRLVSGPFRAKPASPSALPARMVDAGLRAPPGQANGHEATPARSLSSA
jgi:hypothetical protein